MEDYYSKSPIVLYGATVCDTPMGVSQTESLLGMRGIDRQQGGERRGSYGGGAQAAHDPFASQRMSGASGGY
jgi:hypothetical protein